MKRVFVRIGDAMERYPCYSAEVVAEPGIGAVEVDAEDATRWIAAEKAYDAMLAELGQIRETINARESDARDLESARKLREEAERLELAVLERSAGREGKKK